MSSVESAKVPDRYDPGWGENPSPIVALPPEAAPVSADDIIAWRRADLAHYTLPRTIAFGPISTGKIPKFELGDRAKEIVS